MQSKRFSLNKKDYEIMITRAKEYLIPLAGLYVGTVLLNTKDGFQWSDFYLSELQQGGLVLYILNRIHLGIQLFRDGKK